MKIHRSVIARATTAQLEALRDNVLRHWDHVEDDDIVVTTEASFDPDTPRTILVDVGFMVIGIEPDGYTHS